MSILQCAEKTVDKAGASSGSSSNNPLIHNTENKERNTKKPKQVKEERKIKERLKWSYCSTKHD